MRITLLRVALLIVVPIEMAMKSRNFPSIISDAELESSWNTATS